MGDLKRHVYTLSCCVLFLCAVALGSIPTGASAARPVPEPSPIAQVVQLQNVSAERAVALVRGVLPRVRVEVDPRSNSLVLFGSPDDVQTARSIIQGVDVKNPMRPMVEVIQLRAITPKNVIARIKPLFPHAQISVASNTSVLLRSTLLDGSEIKALIASLDVPPETPSPAAVLPVETITVKQGRPRDVARAVARAVPRARLSVSGSSLLVTGDPDAVTKARTLAQSLDVPPFGSQYTQIYRVKNIDAKSLGDLIERSYPRARVGVNSELNSIAVTANAGDQERISDAVNQLDGAQGVTPGQAGNGAAAFGDQNLAVVDLLAPMPGQNQSPSTTAQDIATAVTQSLSQLAPDLRVTVPANAAQIILAGSPTSIRMAKDLIARLDTSPRLVELDTEVYEVDESVAKNVGLQLPQAVLSTTFSEVLPTPDPNGNPGRLSKINTITRTGLQLTAQLNLLVQNGHGRVLADPRIATLSGHTASIRAGDQLNIITTTGGGVGTPVTQQLQTFNTGVTLDITPMVSGANVIVALHPVVNSLSGIVNGVPQISTRDTQTTITLHDNQTLVIGGLIQESDQASISSIPVLGQLPLVGRVFRNDNINTTRNELVLIVTPHVLHDGEAPPAPDATMGLPTAEPLPTLPPGSRLPTPRADLARTPLAIGSPLGGGAVLNTPVPAATQIPMPTPSAFGSTNVFEYGTAPQNTYAGVQDTPQIFYARFSPTVVNQGTSVTVYTVTTTNVSRVTIGASGFESSLGQVGPSKWKATFPISALNISPGQKNMQLTLKAYRGDGFSASILVPISLSTSAVSN